MYFRNLSVEPLTFTFTIEPEYRENVRVFIQDAYLESYSHDRWADDGGCPVSIGTKLAQAAP